SDEAGVERGMLATDGGDGVDDGVERAQRGARRRRCAAREAARDLDEAHRAWIAGGIELVAEAGERLAALEARGDDGAGATRIAGGLGDERLEARAFAAVARARHGGERGGDAGVDVGAGGGGDARGE